MGDLYLLYRKTRGLSADKKGFEQFGVCRAKPGVCEATTKNGTSGEIRSPRSFRLVRRVCLLVPFAVIGGGQPCVFFECARKMTLRRKTEVSAYGNQSFIGIAEQIFRLLRFFAQDKIGEVFTRFAFKFRGKFASADKERFCDRGCADRFGEVVQYVVAHIENEL